MEFVYFTISGIVLYFGSDWILNKIEDARGKRFQQRSVVFFTIIMVLAVSSFAMIQYLTTN